MLQPSFRPLALALVLSTVACGGAMSSVPAPTASVAPVVVSPAQAILDRYSKVVDPGGRAASIAGFKSSGTFEMPAAGIKGNLTAFQGRPNMSAILIEIPGVGDVRQGFDGTTAWATDPFQGPRIMTGLEAAASSEGADFRALVRPADLFSAIEMAGDAELDGEKCVRVKLTWKSSRVSTECYSVATGLIIETRGVQVTQQGDIETVSRIFDYRSVGGVLIPHRTVNSMMGTQQIFIFTEIVPAAQDPKLFELPPQIKALKIP